MEALFHLVFVLIKIIILGCIYSTLTLVVFKIIGRIKLDSWFNKASRKKLRLWFLSFLVIFICLIIYMSTYYGDHGLGDSARVPVGHGRAIQEANGNLAYIQDEGPINMLEIDKFIVTDDYIFGLTGETNENYNGKYFAYEMINNKVRIFEMELDYLSYLDSIKIDTKQDYKDFGFYYNQYWSGWRFWTLP